MKNLKSLYLLPVALALTVSVFLILFFIPSDFQFASLGIVILTNLILGIGFRWISKRKLRTIRIQLLQILQTLEKFDIDQPKKVKFQQSSFTVFNDLNEYLTELIDKIRTNYQAHKQFTQNASHELQTPLAVIKGHIELLLQSPKLGEEEMMSLALVLKNTDRLSKINSTLILLSKIEHKQFVDTEKVQFRRILEEVFENFNDLISMKNLEIRKSIQGEFEVEMSRTLAEILLANLVQNAIRHNLPKGFINIEISTEYFIMSNSGKNLEASPETLFTRFQKESDIEDSLGLGLSIVKRICERSQLHLSYTFDQGIHQLKVSNPL